MAGLVDKQKKREQYESDFQQAKVAVVAEYRGLSVEQLSELRRDLFKLNAKFTVTKNTLVKRALKATDGASELEDLFQGPTAVLFGFDDEVSPTRTLKNFLQKAKIGEIKGGLMAGQRLSAAEVKDLADLPPLEELRGKLLGAINAPQAGLVMSLAGPQRALVTVLDQFAKQKEEQGA